RIDQKVSQANDAVLLIRGVRSQIEARLKTTNDPAVRSPAGQLEQKLAAIEGRIYQVQNRSSQDPLNFPIMLNNKLAALAAVVEEGEAAPTDQSYAVLADLSERLDGELAALDQLLAAELPRLNAQLSAVHLPAIERRPEPAVEQGTATASDLEEDEDEE